VHRKKQECEEKSITRQEYEHAVGWRCMGEGMMKKEQHHTRQQNHFMVSFQKNFRLWHSKQNTHTHCSRIILCVPHRIHVRRENCKHTKSRGWMKKTYEHFAEQFISEEANVANTGKHNLNKLL
jgi:tryptophan synthase beta subunit